MYDKLIIIIYQQEVMIMYMYNTHNTHINLFVTQVINDDSLRLSKKLEE
jgi:hypothetical protein